MKLKHMVASLGAVVFIVSASGGARAQFFPWFDSVIEKIQTRETLKVGIGLFEPWSMCNTDGELIGFEIDIAEKIAEDMEVDLELRRTYWPDIIPDLIDEEFDVIISGMTITPTRNLRVNFTSPTAESGLWVVANKTKLQDVTELEDLNTPSVVVAAREGATSQIFVETSLPLARVLLFDTEDDLLGAVLRGDAHASVVYGPTPARWIEENPTVLYRPFEELFSRGPEAIGLRKGDPDGLNFFNSWIAVHRASGWLGERRQYWFETSEWAAQVATDAQSLAQCAESFE